MIKTSQIIGAKGYMYTLKHVNSVFNLKFCAHQHKLMYALFLCLSHTVWKQRTLFMYKNTKYFRHWFSIQCSVLSVRSEWLILFQCFSFFAFCFSAEKDMILLGILASTPMNDCEMTCLRSSRQTKRQWQHQRTTYIVEDCMQGYF